MATRLPSIECLLPGTLYLLSANCQLADACSSERIFQEFERYPIARASSSYILDPSPSPPDSDTPSHTGSSTPEHRLKPPSPPPPGGMDLFDEDHICVYCQRWCRGRSALRVHMRIHNGIKRGFCLVVLSMS